MNWKQLLVLTLLLGLLASSKWSTQSICLFLFLTAVYGLIYVLIKRKCTQVETFTFNSANPEQDGPKVLIVGTTHGNEPAGGEALNRLIKMLQSQMLSKGTLVLIPYMNPCGKALGFRYQPHKMLLLSDSYLNRNYPTSDSENGKCEVSQAMTKFIPQFDFVIDLHEGWGYHQLDPESLGSGIYPNKQQLAEQVATQMAIDLNQSIPIKTKQFIVEHIPDLKGSLRSLCDLHNIPYVLIETTGQDNIQPLSTRANQHLTLIQSALRQLGLL